MAPVLQEEESLSARHHTNAEAGKVGIEGNVVFGCDLERLDRPLGDLDLRHTCTCSRNVPTQAVWSNEVSWKRRGSGANKVVA